MISMNYSHTIMEIVTNFLTVVNYVDYRVDLNVSNNESQTRGKVIWKFGTTVRVAHLMVILIRRL